MLSLLLAYDVGALVLVRTCRFCCCYCYAGTCLNAEGRTARNDTRRGPFSSRAACCRPSLIQTHTHARAESEGKKYFRTLNRCLGNSAQDVTRVCATFVLLERCCCLPFKTISPSANGTASDGKVPQKNKWDCNWCGCCGKILFSVTSRGNVLIKLKNTLNIGCGVNANPLLLASHGAAWWLMVWLRASARLV